MPCSSLAEGRFTRARQFACLGHDQMRLDAERLERAEAAHAIDNACRASDADDDTLRRPVPADDVERIHAAVSKWCGFGG